MAQPNLCYRVCLALGFALAVFVPRALVAEDSKSDFPPHAEVLKGFEKVISTAPGDEKPLWTIYKRKKDQQVYAELPSNFASQKYFIALTVASGERFAGLQGRSMYVYWRRYNDQLALIEPNIEIRSTGDAPSKASVKRLFTDRVLMNVPIATIGPGGGPVIDLDRLFVGQAQRFFGASAVNRRFPGLYKIAECKSFPQNIEIAFEVPNAQGTLQELHYSVSVIQKNPDYDPRKADSRVGYFTTSYADYGQYNDDDVRTRYINRWHIEKADSDLELSLPEEPIIFYIEHTTPVRYRRWVRNGILAWNEAFRKIGIDQAIEVRVQNAETGAYMELDPEDVRYNFVRWLNNDQGLAIGPSRVNPMTGEILDADIILTDGWIRHFEMQFSKVLPQIAMESMSAETLAWLADHRDWDPRIRLAPPGQRDRIARQIDMAARKPLAGHPAGAKRDAFFGTQRYDGLIGQSSQFNGLCLAAQGRAFDVALMRLHMSIATEMHRPVSADKPKKSEDDEDDAEKDEEKKEDKEKEDEESKLDGMPVSFIGPLLAHLVAHEVGHTLGLRHNFKASSITKYTDINSKGFAKSGRPMSGSVMDYTPINISPLGSKVQGPWVMKGIGPYDAWAIEYGYTFEDDDLDKILARSTEPQLRFGTDGDAAGTDPLTKRYDYGKNPLVFAKAQMELAQHHREHLLEAFVDEGDSWEKAREGYELTLSLQTHAIETMANWVGGTFVHRVKKGAENAPDPLVPVPAKKQRAALEFVMDAAFHDSAFGLTGELLRHMTVEKWLDGNGAAQAFRDSTWPLHDRIMGIQASVLTMLLNPTTLRRVYDNEAMVPAEDEALTLAELMDAVRDEIWSELDEKPDSENSLREPMISSLRRNLQKEHLDRLIDLAAPGSTNSAAYKPIGDLAQMQLEQLQGSIKHCLAECKGKIDTYTQAHLLDCAGIIEKALDTEFIYNPNPPAGGGSGMIIVIGKDGKPVEP